MRILFSTTGTNALGESYTAACFAKQLMKSGHQCFFIAPKLGFEYIKTFGFTDESIVTFPSRKELDPTFRMEENYDDFKQFVNKASPDIVLVGDWHHFQENGNAPNDAYSLYWFDDKIKIGTFDHIGFTPNGKMTVMLYKCGDFLNKKFIALSDRYSFVIRPCPHHTNISPKQGNVYYWGIFEQKVQTDFESNKAILKQYEASDSLVIFHPIGFWQQRIIQKVFENKNIREDYYFDIMLPLIYDYLAKTGMKVTYFIISGETKNEVKRVHKNIQIIMKPPLKNELFMNYLGVSDVFITDNIMSSNLGKAVFANKIPIVYKNSLDLRNNLPASFQLSDGVRGRISSMIDAGLIFPHLSFPIGFEELNEMYQNNLFSSAFIQQEIYNEDANVKLFNEIAEGKQYKDLTSYQNKYMEANKNLLSAEEILLEVYHSN